MMEYQILTLQHPTTTIHQHSYASAIFIMNASGYNIRKFEHLKFVYYEPIQQ